MPVLLVTQADQTSKFHPKYPKISKISWLFKDLEILNFLQPQKGLYEIGKCYISSLHLKKYKAINFLHLIIELVAPVSSHLQLCVKVICNIFCFLGYNVTTHNIPQWYKNFALFLNIFPEFEFSQSLNSPVNPPSIFRGHAGHHVKTDKYLSRYSHNFHYFGIYITVGHIINIWD